MVHRFCAICGKPLEEDAPHFGMCLECYVKESPLFEIPNHFSFRTCLDCGKYSIKDEWIEPSENNIYIIIKEAINRFLLKSLYRKGTIDLNSSIDEESFNFSSKDLLKSLEMVISGTSKINKKISYQQNVKVSINYELCKNCTNLRGGTYFLSIVQLRVKDEVNFYKIKEVLDFVYTQVEKLFEKDPRQYITKSVDEKYGVDLYLSTNELMNYIIKILRGNYHFVLKRSKKLVGRDIQGGKNLYRQKALIKFIPIRRNDVIEIEGKDYIVESILKNKVILRNQKDEKLIKDFSFFFGENLSIKHEQG
ncbi:MAG: hypothetical protein JW891_01090 [Candidatus Lokiarchaeota archaeon]|nr:hypothetical protein [Candidatus Lokiarchaeota archaeon]